MNGGLSSFALSVILGGRGPLYRDRRPVINRKAVPYLLLPLWSFGFYIVLEPAGGDVCFFASVSILVVCWVFFPFPFPV